MVDTKISSNLPSYAANSPGYAKAKDSAPPERQPLTAGGKVSPPQPVVNELPREQLEKASEIIAELAKDLKVDSELEFRVDESTGRGIITVLDSKTGEIIRSLPSEESLAIMRYIAEFNTAPSVGMLMDGVVK